MTKILKIFVLSILIFSTLSFFSIFDDLAQSIYKNDAPNLDLGFPFTYYELFFVEHPNFNYGWKENFIWDYLIALILSLSYYRLKSTNIIKSYKN
ncbi:hypothetical protein IX39_07310 [Chryseobacterium formosense]|uniref:Uncharacterized protein n=1 Tax=Chryseobacterium formosense TaxID=236814 RepID=A0A085Z7N2_9FLAO|nr:hypothetical protein IX39_07310 [Chryseobacterium formosense]SFT33955.1 hypothetical protein SAMN05421857_0164 [Chryseobacterium formosense]